MKSGTIILDWLIKRFDMKIEKIWFDKEYIYGIDEAGATHRQSLLWYPRLMGANDSQRDNYTVGMDGFHWRDVDEDVSFESFFYHIDFLIRPGLRPLL